MDMTDAFNSEIYVPTITSLEGVDIVLQVREQEVTYVITSITDDLLWSNWVFSQMPNAREPCLFLAKQEWKISLLSVLKSFSWS